MIFHREHFLAHGIHSWIWRLSGRYMPRVVLLKVFGPYIEQADVGAVTPEEFPDAPGKPIPS